MTALVLALALVCSVVVATRALEAGRGLMAMRSNKQQRNSSFLKEGEKDERERNNGLR